MRNGILIISVIVIISILHIYSCFLQFNKQQRQTIYKANNISAATIKLSVYLEIFFFCGKWLIFFKDETIILPSTAMSRKRKEVFRMKKIYNNRCLRFGFAIRTLDSHRNTITNKKILLLVDLQKR